MRTLAARTRALPQRDSDERNREGCEPNSSFVREHPTIASADALLVRLSCGGLMIVADLLDLAVRDFHYFRAQRLHDSSSTRAAKTRFGNSATGVARAQTQLAAAVGKKIEAGFVVATDYVATFPTLPGWIDDHRMLVKACHHALDIVLVERVKIALNQFFFDSHMACLLLAREVAAHPSHYRCYGCRQVGETLTRAQLMNHVSALVILVLLLFGPLAISWIEHNIELYCLGLGILATILGAGFSRELIVEAMREPVAISIAVIVAAVL